MDVPSADSSRDKVGLQLENLVQVAEGVPRLAQGQVDGAALEEGQVIERIALCNKTQKPISKPYFFCNLKTTENILPKYSQLPIF